jgi:hypothetical protein
MGGETVARPGDATTQAVAPAHLAARAAGRLPVPLQDAAGATDAGGNALLIGGLDSADRSVAQIAAVSGGRTHTVGSLPAPLHDAAAARVAGHVYLFGGGTVASSDQILRLDSGGRGATPVATLPEPRSDLAAATIGDTVYLVGGFTGQQAISTIAAWTPGRPPRVVGRLPHPLRYAAVAAADGRVVIAGGSSGPTASRRVLVFDPRRRSVTTLARLPHPVTHATAASVGSTVYVIGGRGTLENSPRDSVIAVDASTGRVRLAGALPRPLSDATAIPQGRGILVAGGRGRAAPSPALTMLAPSPPPRAANPIGAGRTRRGAAALTAPGSDPSALPGNLLIADKGNNRLVEVDPRGRTVWRFPRRRDRLPAGGFTVPDDAFFSADGSRIVATQEDDFAISVIDPRSHRIVSRYGTPGVPGAGANQLDNPDDALLYPNGSLLAADIKNCRLVEVGLGRSSPQRVLGTTGVCIHDPPHAFGSPNGAFPTSGGGTVVTEISGDWIDHLDRRGRLVSSAHPPGFSYPSDTNEVHPGLFVSADYASPGAVETFDASGRSKWRFAPTGTDALDHPSLAMPLPNGDFVVNDDYNDRVVVIDPRRNKIVWQYGHSGVAGLRPGYLNTPDGVDLAPPFSLLHRFPRASPPR